MVNHCIIKHINRTASTASVLPFVRLLLLLLSRSMGKSIAIGSTNKIVPKLGSMNFWTMLLWVCSGTPSMSVHTNLLTQVRPNASSYRSQNFTRILGCWTDVIPSSIGQKILILVNFPRKKFIFKEILTFCLRFKFCIIFLGLFDFYIIASILL